MEVIFRRKNILNIVVKNYDVGLTKFRQEFLQTNKVPPFLFAQKIAKVISDAPTAIVFRHWRDATK